MIKLGKRTAVRGIVSLTLGLAAVLTTAGLATASSAAPGSAGHSSVAAIPRVDIVGKGRFACKDVTGEVGFTPRAIAGGRQPMMVSLWFVGTDCAGPAGPLPKQVVGSISFPVATNRCPVVPPATGAAWSGFLNLAYNFPPVPAPVMIDPSFGPAVAITPVVGGWMLKGPLFGSYPTLGNAIFTATLRLARVGPETCRTGITSLRIASGLLLNV